MRFLLVVVIFCLLIGLYFFFDEEAVDSKNSHSVHSVVQEQSLETPIQPDTTDNTAPLYPVKSSIPKTSVSNSEVDNPALTSMALEDDQQESHQYELPELNSLVTENNTFSLKDMISLSDKDKFETALNQLMDKASYITELAEINQQYKNYFNDLAQVHDGDIFIDNLACDHSFCLASFQLLNGSDWDISTLSRQENTPMYNLYISQLDGSLNDRQVLIFSTDKSIDGIDAP